MELCSIPSMKAEFMDSMNFNDSYQRNNKAKGKKNLVRLPVLTTCCARCSNTLALGVPICFLLQRCFPDCRPEGHVGE
jgi:hypothetical protein